MTAPAQVRDAVPGQGLGGGRTPLLEVRDLSVTFKSRGRKAVRAVDGVSLDLMPGETVEVAISGIGSLINPAKNRV